MLALVCAAFSIAIIAANYLQPLLLLMLTALFAASLAYLKRCGRIDMKRLICAAASATLGLLCFAVNHALYIKTAESLGGNDMDVLIRAKTPASELSESVSLEGELILEGRPSVGVIVYDRTGSLNNIRPGQYASFYGRLKTADTRYGEDYDYYHSVGIFLTVNTRGDAEVYGRTNLMSLVYRVRAWLVNRINSLYSERQAVFIRALLTGDKYAFYDDIPLSTDMSIAGLTHIVAVSGMHISILASLLCAVFGKSRQGSIVCMVLIWFFVMMTGASPSAVRAGIMNSMLLVGGMFGRESRTLPSLSFALCLILLSNPFAAKSVSLQLSFAAVLGIVLTSCGFEHMELYRRNTHGFIADYAVDTAVCSVGVMLFTAPLSALHFGSLSILSPLSNLLCLWAVPACFCLSYIGILMPCLSGMLIKLLVFVSGLLADYIGFMAGLIAKIPMACIYTEAKWFVPWLILGYALILAAFFVKKRRIAAFGLALVLSLGLAGIFSAITRLEYENGARFCAIDVGQGQSLAVMCGEDTVLIDCGSILSFDNAGEKAGRYLISRGRKDVDVLVLTHLHADHANGVSTLFEYVPVKKLILPENVEDEDGLLTEIITAAERNGTELYYIAGDESISLGKLKLRLIAPPAHGDDNERCLAIRLSCGDYDCFVAGDSPSSRELELIEEYELSDTELIVANHHGSRHSSCEEYLRALGGDTAIVSCGYNNFGHPTEEALERLRLCGYNIYRTDIESTVEIRIDNNGKG